MHKTETFLKNTVKYKKIIAILTLVLMFLSGWVLAESSWRWPAPGFSHISSPFGPRILNGKRGNHKGIDIPTGRQPGYAAIASRSGVVTKAGPWDSYGNCVEIDHGDGFRTRYGHLNAISVKEGQSVEQGQVIGEIGTTGRSTGIHLHFEVRKDGTALNPSNFVSPDGSSSVKYDGASTVVGPGPGGDRIVDEDGVQVSGSGYGMSGVNVQTNKNFYYQGAPKGYYSASTNILEKILKKLGELLDYLLGILVGIVKYPFIGFASLVEVMLTDVVNSITGQSSYIRQQVNVDLYVDPRRAVNIENIILGRIELLNADFFVSPAKVAERTRGLTATGQEIEDINRRAEISGDAGTATRYDESQDTIEYEKSVPGLIRAYYAKIYYMLFSIILISMILTLMGISVGQLLTSSAEKKGDLKAMFIKWLKTFLEVFGSMLFVFLIIKLNSLLLDVFVKNASTDKIYKQTFSLYETIRTRAYDLRITVGLGASIIYFILVWYTVRFFFVYVKRAIAVMILALFGPLLSLYEMVMSIVHGAPQDGKFMSKWKQEFTYLVLIQAIHVFIYTITIVNVMKLTESSLIGYVFAIYMLKLMLTYSGEIRRLFNLETGKHSTLKNVLDKSDPIATTKQLMIASEGAKTAWKYYKKKDGLREGIATTVGNVTRGTANTILRGYSYIKNRSGDQSVANQENLQGRNVIGNPEIEMDPEVLEERNKYFESIFEKTKISKENLEILQLLDNEDLKYYMNNPELIEELVLGSDGKPELPQALTNMEYIKGQYKDKIKRFNDATKNLVTLDSDGVYTILPPVKTIVNGKVVKINSPSKKYFEELGKIFGVNKKMFAEAKNEGISGLKTGLSIALGAFVFPVMLTNSKSVKTLYALKPSGKKRNVKLGKINQQVSRRKKRKKYKRLGLDIANTERILTKLELDIRQGEKEALERAIPDAQYKEIKLGKKGLTDKEYKRVKDKYERDLIKNKRDINKIVGEINILRDALKLYDMQLTLDSNVGVYGNLNNGKFNSKEAKEFFGTLNDKNLEKNIQAKTRYINATKEIMNAKRDMMTNAEILKISGKEEAELQNKILRLNQKYDDSISEIAAKYNLKEEVGRMLADGDIGVLNKIISKNTEDINEDVNKLMLTKLKNKQVKEIMLSGKELEKELLSIANNIETPDDLKIAQSEEIAAKTLMNISGIIDEEVKMQTIGAIGADNYNKAEGIERKLKTSIYMDIEKSVLADDSVPKEEKAKELEKRISKIQETINKDTDSLKTYLDEDELDLFKTYQKVKNVNLINVSNKSVDKLIKDWENRTVKTMLDKEAYTVELEKELDDRIEYRSMYSTLKRKEKRAKKSNNKKTKTKTQKEEQNKEQNENIENTENESKEKVEYIKGQLDNKKILDMAKNQIKDKKLRDKVIERFDREESELAKKLNKFSANKKKTRKDQEVEHILNILDELDNE